MRPVRVEASVLEVRPVGPRTVLLAASGSETLARAQPGQFAMLQPRSWGVEPFLPRPMSFLAAGPDRVEFLIRRVGRGSRMLSELRPGDALWITGPLGTGWPQVGRESRVLLVAGGVGVAPLLFWLERRGGRDVTLLYGARTETELVLRDRVQASGAGLRPATEDGTCGHRGLVTDLLDREVRGGRGLVLSCGPWPMMRACWDAARRAGWSCYVGLEARMACGVGLCLGCAVPRSGGGYFYACRHGPCVDASVVDWRGVAPL